ncbi:MAG: glutathione S-transferase [Myxococcota bacterium]
MKIPRDFNNLQALAVSVARLGRGLIARPGTRQPEQMLELYEFEACPFCRKVRDVLTELDISFVSRTCAKGANTRDEVSARLGKGQFPYLIDPNTGQEMVESEAIIDYLYATYAAQPRGRVDKLLAPLNTAGAAFAGLLRVRGARVRPGHGQRTQPAEMLEVWNFEASPYCRKVREALHELNLDFVTHNVGKRSARRPQLVALGGKMRVPYLVDPNTETAMYESNDILAYLYATYGG